MKTLKSFMEAGGCSPKQIERFLKRVDDFVSGDKAFYPESSIEPVASLPRLDELEPRPELLKQTAMIKLNGGLGTSMGLTGPKGLLKIKGDKDFYAILADQVTATAAACRHRPPLIFMNSFSTERQTEERLEELGFRQSLPLGFRQSQVPKIRDDGSLPEAEEEFAWCPPGHGDIYAALLDSGLKDRLLEAGIRYLFVSNIDNLGAVLDSRPPAYMADRGLAFLMEVTRRTENDKKGGHLAIDRQGRLLLREVAQCPPEDLGAFQDIERHRFFNTNNLWLDLNALDEGWTDLPLIVNRKPVVPHRPDSSEIVQLEQAMGAAISIVEKAGAVEVERDRFLPVKTTNDLLLLRSDLYHLLSNGTLECCCEKLPPVDLDQEYFKMIADFERLIPSVPSLLEVQSLKVSGPVELHEEMLLRGEVHLNA